MRSMVLSLVAALAVPASAVAARIEAYQPSDGDRFESEIEGTAVNEPWWTVFADDELASLVEQGLTGNRDLAAAWGRVEQAQARTVQTLSPVLPSVSFDVLESTSPYDSLGFQFGGLPSGPGGDADDDPEVYHSGSAMLNVRVPLNLWNGTLSAVHASRFDAAASEGDGEAQAMALASRIAGAYFDVLAAREQVQIVRGQIEAHDALLELTQLRYRQSDASALDVLQQKQQQASTQAMLPQARVTLRTQENQLAALLGRSEPVTVLGSSLPNLPPAPATGTPADLADNRPDLRASDARLVAARSRKDAAVGALAPSLSLSGNVGTQLIYFDELDTQETWGLGASLSIPLFQGARNWAALIEARAGQRVAADSHSQAVLQAIGDVENAVVREQETAEQLRAHQAQLDAARLAFDESRRHYESSLTSYLTVLTALSSQQQAELSVLSTRRSLLDARIRLYESLGGAWTDGLSATAGGR
jgi:outer membrane protein, multidrug efflux system